MRSLALIALLSALVVAACAYDQPPPPPPAPAVARAPRPPAPPPPPPPGGLTITGVVLEKRGYCHAIQGDNGQRYAVHRGVLGEIPQGARVRLVGVIHPRQDCAGATVIRPDGGVRRIGGSA
jgi:hypothetical protein